MACVVPLGTYGFFLSEPKTFIEEVCRGQLAVRMLSTSVTRSTNLAGSKYSCRSISTVIRSSSSTKTTMTTTMPFSAKTLSRHFCQHISCYFNESFSAHVVISGFWEGPDTEDGWGFVEAFVYQI